MNGIAGEMVEINMISLNGETVYNSSVAFTGTNQIVKINVSHLAKGAYVLRMVSSGNVITHSLILQ